MAPRIIESILGNWADASVGARISSPPPNAKPTAAQIEVFPIPDIEISCAEPTWSPSSCANVPDQSPFCNQPGLTLAASCQGIDRKSNQPESCLGSGEVLDNCEFGLTRGKIPNYVQIITIRAGNRAGKRSTPGNDIGLSIACCSLG